MVAHMTHRRQTSEMRNGHILFAEDHERNEHYGPFVWVLTAELPEVPEVVVEMAAEFFGVGLEEAYSMVNPEDIVDSAEAWDNEQFASDVYWTCGEPVGFRTPDGAVVLAPQAANLEAMSEKDYAIRFQSMSLEDANWLFD